MADDGGEGRRASQEPRHGPIPGPDPHLFPELLAHLLFQRPDFVDACVVTLG